MNSSTFTVVFDACVLYPANVRDLLVRLACTGCFRARWSDDIHDEWIRSLLEDRPDLTRERLERTAQLMNDAVEDCLVTDYTPLIDGIEGLPDPDDRHVVAAAIRCGASVVVTYNLKDFPATALERWGLEVQHPDEFVENVFDLHQAQVLGAVRGMRLALKNPHLTIEEIFNVLLKAGLAQTVNCLEDYKTML